MRARIRRERVKLLAQARGNEADVPAPHTPLRVIGNNAVLGPRTAGRSGHRPAGGTPPAVRCADPGGAASGRTHAARRWLAPRTNGTPPGRCRALCPVPPAPG
jgi:hypothetical protein